ncbi:MULTISPECIES: D-alanyl-D-alanine carboxypeptidase/D-alanyl-D-alanine-endopeptidase [Neobacillus]|uniref:D-alanyl-D-alanine carboxypeptidase/D-alanyl-D-alanine endopeptidase n=1 Tax=Neobacillus sp. 114 TaxID=3048535 RepID=UPI0024C30876|nr:MULTISPECIES: D-alanyl-D-alanine carboxypeptidase/D-alanyl-D-alanine-endopeptidase [Neobacillus]
MNYIAQDRVIAERRSVVIESQINELLSSSLTMQGAIAGISIRSAEDGKMIYEYNGDVRLRPASNMKLLTAAAALKVLGEDYTFPTEIHIDGSVKKKTLAGNLYIKGKGDPTLMKENFDNLAKEIRKNGITKIKGNLIGDDSHFDDVRYPLDLPWSDETTYYGAQISALTASPTTDYDSGSVEVIVTPSSKAGEKPKVKITPETSYVKIVNHAVTVGENDKKDITIKRKHAKNTITIEGTVPIKTKAVKEWVGVWEPTRYALALFKQSLEEQGIKVSGKIKTGKVPDNAILIITHKSMPLSELLVPFMKLSNNVHAEMLVKEMGKVVLGEGSWEKGLEVLNLEMVKFGLNSKTMVIRDGSGVSHVDLIPANEISKLLFVVQKETWFSSYQNSLPVSGVPEKMAGGSLRYRMKTADVQGRVKAKTGTLSTVSSLSGYVTTKNGQTLIFSIILNNLLDEEKGKKLEDEFVKILANQ